MIAFELLECMLDSQHYWREYITHAVAFPTKSMSLASIVVEKEKEEVPS